jgi:hypothetical protein
MLRTLIYPVLQLHFTDQVFHQVYYSLCVLADPYLRPSDEPELKQEAQKTTARYFAPRSMDARATLPPAEIGALSAAHSRNTAMGFKRPHQMEIAAGSRFPTVQAGPASSVCCLPAEMLMEVLEVAVRGDGHDPLEMMHVCRYWRAIAFGLAPIWSRLTIRPCTLREYVKFALERAKHALLEVEINLNSKRGDDRRTCPVMDLVIRTMSRWRTLTLAGLPAQLDIGNTAAGEENPTTALAVPQLEALNINGDCEMSSAFTQLLETVATTSTDKLATVELASPDALQLFASPTYRVFFRRLSRLKIDMPRMTDEVDILPYFECLVEFDASRVQLPMYDDGVDLPVTRTLRRMNLKSVPVKWMWGQTFPLLEDVTLVRPRRSAGGCMSETVADLPEAKRFALVDRSIGSLSHFHLPRLDALVVRTEAYNKRRGSRQLASVWGAPPNASSLRPRVLHLDVHCHSQDLVNALRLHPHLEELVLGLVRPSALGKKFFNGMATHHLKGAVGPLGPVSVSVSGSAQLDGLSSEGLLVADLVPNLTVFGLRCRRWIRQTESDDITPRLREIIRSREETEVPLHSVKLWHAKDTPEGAAIELVVTSNVNMSKCRSRCSVLGR